MSDPSSSVRRVMIVDDHPLFRMALQVALTKAFPDGIETVEAGRLDEAVTQAESAPVDAVLLDLQLADSTDFDGLTRIRGVVGPAVPIAVVSATESRKAYLNARALGASGYLPKSLPPDRLADALRRVVEGEEWFPSEAARMDADDAAAKVASLTPAQRKVLNGLTSGLLNKQIAFEMGIAEATVKAHMTAILRKLDANNRTHALLIYKQATQLDEGATADPASDDEG